MYVCMCVLKISAQSLLGIPCKDICMYVCVCVYRAVCVYMCMYVQLSGI